MSEQAGIKDLKRLLVYPIIVISRGHSNKNEELAIAEELGEDIETDFVSRLERFLHPC